MVMKSSLLMPSGMAALLIFTSSSVFSTAPKPNKCPDISVLSQVSFATAERTDAFPDKWYVMQVDHVYDTNVTWDFAVVVDGANESEAFINAKNSFQNMNQAQKPRKISDTLWMCEYLMSNGPEAVAFHSENR